MDKVAKILKIDLHIHSKASSYKEDSSILDHSGIEDIDLLLEKLDSNGIGIAAITDHNRFDVDLYEALNNKVEDSEYTGSVEIFLPAVEFDVLLEEGKKACHIIAIFDNQNIDKVKRIKAVIESHLLHSKEAYYDKNEFEAILRACDLDVILIGHQFVSLVHAEGGRTKSVSESTEDVGKLLKVGYISALEYQKPPIEGMILDSLKEVDLKETPLVIGSDCHQWSAYPSRCEGVKPKGYITSFKCLPTFKGLLFSITSFKTRTEREISDSLPIKKIKLGETEVPLSPSLNAVIGDNGSGKTLLLSLLNGSPESFHEKIIQQSLLKVDSSTSDICFTSQGSITKKAKEGNLFEEKYFNPIPTIRDFRIAIEDYFNQLYRFITNNISKTKAVSELDGKGLVVELHTTENYHVNVSTATLSQEDDIHASRLERINSILRAVNSEYMSNKEYYERFDIDFRKTIEELQQIKKDISKRSKETKARNLVKGYVVRSLADYDEVIHSSRTSQERERVKYRQSKDSFIESIVAAVKVSSSQMREPEFPKPMPGNSSKPFVSFNFSKKVPYDNKSMRDMFFEELFTSGFQKEETVLAICSQKDLESAISGIKSLAEIERWKSVKLNKFITECSKEEMIITQDPSGTKVGATDGEKAMAYYKFILTERPECVFIIDQPEDDINPRRIESDLNRLLNRIRDEKQIIFATHNPLLVVNLDVDNVIFVENTNGSLTVKSGCLEYEEADYKVTDLVELNLDGGHKAIERRLRVYGKEN